MSILKDIKNLFSSKGIQNSFPSSNKTIQMFNFSNYGDSLCWEKFTDKEIYGGFSEINFSLEKDYSNIKSEYSM